jgi:RecB family exonuclease
VARRVKAARRQAAATGPGAFELDRVAVVYKRPLPYLYLAREVFGGAGIPYQTTDTLPLAAEPFAAALDLIFEFVASSFTRNAIVSLLRSPHLRFEDGKEPLGREAIAALDAALSEARYLGGLDRLTGLAAEWCREGAEGPALRAAIGAAEELAPLRSAAPASIQFDRLLAFLAAHERPIGDDDVLASRRRRVRSAITDALEGLAAASRCHDDAALDIESLAAMVRRIVHDQTCAPEPERWKSGLQLVDEQAARYGDFDEIAIVGLVEGEWPERARRNIFYPSSLLNSLGWPSERDWRAAAEASFVDLVASAGRRVRLSTISLDDEALVEPSSILHEVFRAGLGTATEDALPPARIFVEEALSLDPVTLDPVPDDARPWAELRLARTPASDAVFHGRVCGPQPRSVSALEAYLACPFKFFAQHVLLLEEEPDDEEVMDPRTEGQLVHEVFERFFEEWQARGGKAITRVNLARARELFEEIVEECLAPLSATEASLVRTRLLGSSAAAGLGDAVLHMEAERPVEVVERLLEYRLDGTFTLQSESGPRMIPLKGKTDRIDLLADGSFRLIDYKLGWPPNRARALQLPIYSACAEQRLSGYRGRKWAVSEAAYLAFKGPRRVVPLFISGDRDRVLRESQQRLVDTVDAIGRGEFPPRPDDVFRCETCAYAAVCRKDYVDEL